MEKRTRSVVLFLVIAMMLTSLISSPAMAQEGRQVDVVRIAGNNRYETALKVSQVVYSRANTVILASGENFPDALAGGVLSAYERAPLLLTRKTGLDGAVANEILKLSPSKVIILGGETVVPENIASFFTRLGIQVERIAGINRRETAVKIAERVTSGYCEEVFLVNADNYPDALTIGPVAVDQQIPILLTKTNTLSTETAEALESLGVEKITIIGGKMAVSSNVEMILRNRGYQVERIEGATRDDTALMIAKKYFPYPEGVIIAQRDNFPDALVGGYFGARYNIPIILVYKDKIRDTVERYLEDQNLTAAFILGGPSAVSESVEKSLLTLYSPIKFPTMPAKIQLTSSAGVKVGVEVKDMGISKSSTNYDYISGMFRHTHVIGASVYLNYKAYNKQGVVVDTGHLAWESDMRPNEWYSFERMLDKSKGIVRIEFDLESSDVHPDPVASVIKFPTMPAKVQLKTYNGVKVDVEVKDMKISETSTYYDYVSGIFRHTHSKGASIFLGYKAYNKQGVVVDTGYLAAEVSMPSKEWYSFECMLAKSKGIVRLEFDLAASSVSLN